MANDSEYSVVLNHTEYELNDEWREAIERRAELAFEGNEYVSYWWRVATPDDQADEDSIHEMGDPVLVIETAGHKAPWDQLDQFEMEQSVEAFEEFDNGNDMKTVDADEVQGEREIPRLHFDQLPEQMESVAAPEGERKDRVPAKPDPLDSEKLVVWVPEEDAGHIWQTGEAMAPLSNWVEWNVQKRADAPRPLKEKDTSHDHWESIANMYDAKVLDTIDQPDDDASDNNDQPSGQVQRKGQKSFDDGIAGGGHWNR